MSFDNLKGDGITCEELKSHLQKSVIAKFLELSEVPALDHSFF